MAYNVIRAFVEGDLDYLKYLSSYSVGGFASRLRPLEGRRRERPVYRVRRLRDGLPTRAITMAEGRPNNVFERCVKCGACYAQCPRSFLPTAAIEKMMDRLRD